MAASIARIWWVMLAGSAAILVLVLALVAMTFLRSSPLRGMAPRAFLLWGGLAFPVAVLAALAVYALIEGSELAARPGEPGAVDRQAVARQWEWRFGDGDGPAEAARLVIPVGRPVHVHVTSLDVVHSFWVPRLAGKIDAIPGHVTVVRIVAPVAGVYHGICAEYCGVGHMTMPFVVEAVDEGAEGSAADGGDGR